MDDTIPLDIRELQDFPLFNTSFQDGPNFRQNLNLWAQKTERLSTCLSGLAEGFSKFYSTGYSHYQAAISVVQNLREFVQLSENRRGNSVAGPIQEYIDALNNIWRYYEVFLNQAKQLNADTVRELANSYSSLKKQYDEVIEKRKSYVASAEKLCSCRHVSHLGNTNVIATLTEECCEAYRIYQMALSRYLIDLRTAHTQGTVSLMKHTMEHMLSAHSYYHSAAQVLGDVERHASDLFGKVKTWKTFYDGEIAIWQKLHGAIEQAFASRCITLFSQDGLRLENGCIPQRKLSGARFIESSGKLGSSMEGWSIVDTVESVNGTDCSNLDRSPRSQHHSPYLNRSPNHSPSGHTSSLHTKPSSSHVRRTYSIPVNDLKEQHHQHHHSVTQPQPPPTPPLQQEQHHHHHHSVTQPLPSSAPLPQQDQLVKRKLPTPKKPRKLIRSISNPDGLAVKFTSSTAGAEEEVSVNDVSMDSLSLSNGSGSPELDTMSNSDGSTLDLPNQHKAAAQVASADDIFNTAATLPTTRSFTSKKKPFAWLRSKHKARKEKEQGGSLTGEKGEDSSRKADDSMERTASPDVQGKGVKPKKLQKGNPKSLLQEKSRDSEEVTVVAKTEGAGPQGDSSGRLLFAPSVARQGSNKSNGKGSGSDGSPLLTPAHTVSNACGGGGCFVYSNDRPLLAPVSDTWIKHGYLMLRMKLPNNRYAWTYIYCVVDKALGQLMIQEQSLPEPRKLENIVLCATKICSADFIDRNFCFRVISPTSEHLFQALNDQEVQDWITAMQAATASYLKGRPDPTPSNALTEQPSIDQAQQDSELYPDAMKAILGVPGNHQCADCASTTDVEWASINLGIVLCIACSGVHRGLGVHVSKVRSLNLDKWDRSTVEYMLSQGNLKANSYYEARLGNGMFADIRKPHANASKTERIQYIQQKYVTLAFVDEKIINQ